MMITYEDLPKYLFSVDPIHQNDVLQKVAHLKRFRKDLRVRDLEFIKKNATFKDISDEESAKKLKTFLRDMETDLLHLCQLYIRCYNGLLYVTELAEEKDPEIYLRLQTYITGFADLHYIEELFELSRTYSFGAKDKLRLLVRPYRQEMVFLIRLMLERTDLLLKGEMDYTSFTGGVI